MVPGWQGIGVDGRLLGRFDNVVSSSRVSISSIVPGYAYFAVGGLVVVAVLLLQTEDDNVGEDCSCCRCRVSCCWTRMSLTVFWSNPGSTTNAAFVVVIVLATAD